MAVSERSSAAEDHRIDQQKDERQEQGKAALAFFGHTSARESKQKNPRVTGGLLLLGYLDSNQEQMIGVSAVPLPRNWGGIPRISAVFMGSSVRASAE